MSTLRNKPSSNQKRNALVTGGGSGIGRSICLKLAESDIKVFVADIDKRAADIVAEEIDSLGGEARAVELDVSNCTQVKTFFEGRKEQDFIDILVNNAGVSSIGNIEATTDAELDRIYAINIKSVYACTQAALTSMKAKQYGVIVNMASVAASVGIVDRFAYSMSKGAVVAMTYSIAKDYIDQGIRCNCVSPARIHTPFVDNFIAKNYPDSQEEMFANLSQSQPIGRMGSPAEVAGLVNYLCSSEAAFITGSDFPIDGGFIKLNN